MAVILFFAVFAIFSPAFTPVAACSDDSCTSMEVEEELRLAQERGAKWLQGKRDQAGRAQMKASMLLQTATSPLQKVASDFMPNGRLVQRTVVPFKANSQKANEAKYKKPTFNPFMPNEITR
mmetsp:Transcript_93899/g.163069  ORF Transcript_93899/g.163069 Transcript_93899/m.163069 type:complete len:122 (+) Transcript_93899:117-482(+)